MLLIYFIYIHYWSECNSSTPFKQKISQKGEKEEAVRPNKKQSEIQLITATLFKVM